MFNLIDGVEVEMTQEEIAARQAEEAAANTAKLQAHLPAYRYQRENEGITVSGVTIPTDIATRTNLLGAKALGTPIKWKTANGFVDLTAEQVSAIATAVGQHVQKCFDAEAAVDPSQYTTTAQIEAAFDAAYSES
jgi:hypothetical protein